MNQAAQEAYLEAQVLTATPQKIRLMLIEGALRFARQAAEAWDQDDLRENVAANVTRCRDIICELLGSVRVGEDPVGRDITAIYLFLFKKITESQLERDASKLAEVIRVLEAERDGWREICEVIPEWTETITNQEITAPTIVAGTSDSAPAGFSLDA